MAPRTVSIVPHTHWDREWYSAFQTFRLRLVDLLDGFLEHLERDPSYARFLLDGQMAVVDDYLEVRPEAEDRLRRLAASGRVAMGPWYVLMDEFLVSGETIWRDLQMGLDRAAAFGGAMPIGYLPDMFGHVAQMPQILRHAGMAHAVVWRGVPSAVDRTAFTWVAPDGSSVRAEYLPQGYGNGASIPEDAKALVRRVRAHEAELAELLPASAPILFMNGTDHEVPQSWLGRVVTEANDIQDDFHFVVTSLAEHTAMAEECAATTHETLPTWHGELRSGARANLLMGVASNRTDVKQAAAVTERALERMAEPLCALYLPAAAWPGRLLEVAWTQVVRNAAHDSICACSVDEVCDAVLHRFAEARQIADGLHRRALGHLRESLAETGTYAVNPSSRPRSGLVEVVLPGVGPVEDGQLLEERPAVLQDVTVPGSELPSVLGALRSQQLDARTYLNRVTIEESDDALDVVFHAGARLRDNLVIEDVRRELYARAGARPGRTVRVRILQEPTRRVLLLTGPVPGFGWSRLAPDTPASPTPPVEVTGEDTLANGSVTVTAEADGTLTVNGIRGFDRLVNDGDHGDTYNYSPPDHDIVVDRPERVSVDVIERGPLRGQLELHRTFRWPERIDDDQRARIGERLVTVTTTVELRAGEDLVRIHTRFDNPCRDHRVRAHLPLPAPAATSVAECAFATVERGLVAEGGPTERGLPTFPSRRFVHAGGLTVAHEGLLEYELVDVDEATATATTLALTLLRATGMLSRVEMAYRPLPAGPPIAMDGPQMLGPVEARYAIHVGGRDPYRVVDDAFLPVLTVTAPGGGSLPPEGEALVVEGGEVSAVRRVPGAVEVRVFNPSAAPTSVGFGARSGWTVDLRGRPQAAFHGQVELSPWQIVTVRLPDGEQP